MFNSVLLNQFMNNMLTSEEQDSVIKVLDDDEKRLRQLQQDLRKSETQEADIIKYLHMTKSEVNKIIKYLDPIINL